MKTNRRLAHVPARTPFQDYMATQRRMKWAGIVAKFAAGLVVLLIAAGKIGA